MALPNNLQKLPPEMLDVLRFLGARETSARTADIESGLNISERVVLKAIRRLINANLIQFDEVNGYTCTGEGKRSYAALLDYDKAPKQATAQDSRAKILRRLTAVIPAALIPGQAMPIFIGIDPPNGGTAHPETVMIDLKVQVLGGAIQPLTASLTVPPDKAAAPARLTITASVSDKPVRVKIDAYQAFQIAELKVAGRLYFDIPVAGNAAAPAGKRAVAADLELIEE
jgi:predicted transcriptional regulator